MPAIDQLLADVRNQLGQAVALNLTRRSSACDVFEAYVFSIVLDAAMRADAQLPIRLEDTYGNLSNIAVFRTSPGRIYTSAPDSPPYTHAVIRFQNKPELE